MARLKNIKLSNFRIHKDTEIENIDNFLVLVGKNDTGKSSILYALDFLFNNREKLSDEDITNKEYGLSISVNDNSSDNFSLHKNRGEENIRFDGKNNLRYYLFDTNTKNPQRGFSVEKLIQYNRNTIKITEVDKIFDIFKCVNDLMKNFKGNSQIYSIFQEFIYGRNVKLLLEHKKEIQQNSPDDEISKIIEKLYKKLPKNADFFQKDGSPKLSNIEFYNRYHNIRRILAENNIAEVLGSEALVRSCVDEFNKSIGNKYFDGWKAILDDFTDTTFRIRKRGSGVQRLCALFSFAVKKTSMLSAEDDNVNMVFAIDEPEISLHPNQQRKLIQCLKKLTEISKIQFLIATHSPFIVKEFEGKNIRVLRKKNSTPAILSDRCIKEYYSLNEINYLAFDEPSEEFHQELYGKIEMDWFGESNGSKSKDILDSLKSYKCIRESETLEELAKKIVAGTPFDWYHNVFISPDKPTQPFNLCHCVRNAIDHPCAGNLKYKEPSVIDLSIKILLRINKCFESIREEFNSKVESMSDEELEQYGDKYGCYVNDDINKIETHSFVWWVRFYLHNRTKEITKVYIIKNNTIEAKREPYNFNVVMRINQALGILNSKKN
ncbi:MAG: AAA family ATPase [Bacteroidales bacterium]|nr:AAA family ATPase [Bacteroidales bacterium]